MPDELLATRTQTVILPSQRTIGKYRIDAELGRGGMGVVHDAHDEVLQRRVALKTIAKRLLDPGEAASLLARFKREAQAAARLTHPNIVAVHDYGEDSEQAFIAMEHVQGRGLDELLAAGDPLPMEDAAPLLAQLLAALQFAHARCVVHRDIKPANVMVTGDGTVKVCDFGIAQLGASQLTQAGTVMGTPSYMAPEQIQGQPTDGRSDLFSAAAVAYQVLTGRKPFTGEHAVATMHAVLQQQPMAPTELNPGLDHRLDALFAKALAKRPEDRFQDAGQLARALAAALRGDAWEIGSEDPTLPPTPLAARTAALKLSSPTLRRIDLSAVHKTAAAPVADRPRVLFVDDEERILSALKLLFRQQYEVHTCTEGSEALELMSRHHFHLVVSDQRMPNMNGTELLSKARERSPNTVRILLTGYSDLAAIVGSVNEGEVYRFASKPWNTNELRDLVAEAAAIGVALEHAPPPAAPDARPEEAVLVLDADREVYLAARDVLGRSWRVLHAADLPSALAQLRDEKVAVLLADIEDPARTHRTFFKLLKQEHPEIVTIAMTAASDSELVIELINQARIFRFLNKPLKLPTLQSHVEAAMAQFSRQQRQPQLLKQQAVAAVKEASGGWILQSLRALRRKIAL